MPDPRRVLWALVAATTFGTSLCALAGETRNVLLVTMDGYRWQELFNGVDARLLQTITDAPRRARLRQRFVRDSAQERRAAVTPFFWSTIATQGMVIGDPSKGSSVTVTNGHFFSYPGYNELLVGFGDPTVDSNDKLYNKNVTVLEWLNRNPAFRGRVAAYGSWDVFPFIINDRRSGVYVNAGWVPLEETTDPETLAAVNSVSSTLPRYWEGVRYDALTVHGALEHMRRHRPRVLYVALGETDDWAHAGRYDLYLEAAVQSDAAIQRLWETAQSIDAYRGSTSLILTTDHGRGDGPKGWESHGADLPGSERMWCAVLGPDTPAGGVVSGMKATQSQVAATVAAFLGEDFTELDPRIAEPLPVLE